MVLGLVRCTRHKQSHTIFPAEHVVGILGEASRWLSVRQKPQPSSFEECNIRAGEDATHEFMDLLTSFTWVFFWKREQERERAKEIGLERCSTVPTWQNLIIFFFPPQLVLVLNFPEVSWIETSVWQVLAKPFLEQGCTSTQYRGPKLNLVI